MAEIVLCPQCGSRQRVATERMGLQLLCGKCRQPFLARADRAAGPFSDAAQAARSTLAPAPPQRSATAGPRLWLFVSVLTLALLVTLGLVLANQWGEWLPRLTVAPTSEANKPVIVMDGGGTSMPGTTKIVQGQTPGTFEFLLGSRLKDVAVGGGGRFLIVHLPKQRQLLVFDARARMLATTIPIEEKNVRFAAGQSKLLVALNEQRSLVRYDLATGQREAAVHFPTDGPIVSLALGAASENPALVYWADGPDKSSRTHVDFLDVNSLQLRKMNVKAAQPGGEPVRHVGDVMHFRAAAEGSVFAAWCTSRNPQGIDVYVCEGNEVQFHTEAVDGGAVLPAADGRLLFTEVGLIAPGAKSKTGRPKFGPRFPSVQGNFYLRVLPDFTGANPPAEICLGGSPLPLQPILLAGAEINNEDFIDNDLTNDKRIHLLPRDNLLITIPASRDRLVLHSFNTKKVLKQAPNYLLIASQPPTLAHPGEKLIYTLEIESKQGGVTCQLDSGPPGATVSPTGEFVWNVPANAPSEAKVSISVTDHSGRNVVHSFRLAIRSR